VSHEDSPPAGVSGAPPASPVGAPSPAPARGAVPSNQGPAPRVVDDSFHIKKSHFYAALLPLSFAAGLLVGYLLWGLGDGGTPLTSAARAAEVSDVQRLNVSPDDDPAQGPHAAPVTLIEFSDFDCPFCRQFHLETFPQLMAAYPGKIRFVYRDFPVRGEQSYIAAQAAHCAGDQGAYWQFHDLLFSGEYPLGQSAYTAYAQRLGLDVDALIECLTKGVYMDEVASDAREAAALGVRGTPTFFINGIPLVGAQPLAVFKQVIESELAR
jgi:protein-disulfide isomerase